MPQYQTSKGEIVDDSTLSLVPIAPVERLKATPANHDHPGVVASCSSWTPFLSTNRGARLLPCCQRGFTSLWAFWMFRFIQRPSARISVAVESKRRRYHRFPFTLPRGSLSAIHVIASNTTATWHFSSSALCCRVREQFNQPAQSTLAATIRQHRVCALNATLLRLGLSCMFLFGIMLSSGFVRHVLVDRELHRCGCLP